MNESFLNALLCTAALLAAPEVLVAQPEQQPAQQISVAGSRASVVGPDEVFTGSARIDPLFPGTEEINASGAYVTFEPGARSAWHTHPKGQHIIVTQGAGLTQEWGKAIQQIKPGDVIWCPPGIKHWHGATSDTAMSHIAVTEMLDGKNVDWLEPVSDAQYLGE